MNAKQKLVETLFDLLTIKSFEDITVSELCRVSKVHRTTFYLYFDNLFELLEEGKGEAMRKIASYYPERKANVDNYMTKEYLVPYLHFIQDNKSLFLAYFTHGDLLNVKEQYEKGILNSISIPRSKGTDSKTIDYISSFYIGGTVSIILKWIDAGFVETPEEIADVILRAIRSGKNL